MGESGENRLERVEPALLERECRGLALASNSGYRGEKQLRIGHRDGRHVDGCFGSQVAAQSFPGGRGQSVRLGEKLGNASGEGAGQAGDIREPDWGPFQKQ